MHDFKLSDEQYKMVADKFGIPYDEEWRVFEAVERGDYDTY